MSRGIEPAKCSSGTFDRARPSSVVKQIAGVEVKNAPKLCLAVVIVSFNYSRYVGAAIESVIDCRREDVELVVVDNASSDGSYDIIESFGIPKSFRLAENLGHLGGCIFGFEQTAAPFVLFLDSDDRLAPGALDRLLPLLKSEVSKVQFPLLPLNSNDEVIGPAFPVLNKCRNSIQLMSQIRKQGCYPTPPTSGNIFRRDLCRLLSEVDYEASGDGIAVLAAPFRGDVLSLEEPQGFYRVHDGNISHSQAGQVPTESRLNDDIQRFRSRVAHLAVLIDRWNLPSLQFDESAADWLAKQRLIRKVVAGEKPGLGEIWQIVRAASTSDKPAKTRLSEAIFFIVVSVAPHDRAMRALAYRFKMSRKSLWTFLGLLASPTASSGSRLRAAKTGSLKRGDA